MTDSNPLDLDNLRAYARAALERAEKASPGPWRHVRQRKGGFGCEHVVSNDKSFETGCMNFWPTDDSRPFPNDPEFIAHSRLDVPNLAASVLTLCAELEQARAKVNHLRDEIKTYEYMGLI